MQKLTLTFLLIPLCLSLSACSSTKIKGSSFTSTEKSHVLIADGVSSQHNSIQLSPHQNRLSTEQKATLNAYRNLAKQLYAIKLSDSLLVAEQVLKNESFRIYFDLFLREAKITDKRMIANQQKVSLILTLTPRFYHCFSNTVAVVSQCLQEENKMAFTRIGYQQAALSTVNLSCSTIDCSHDLHVSGFSKEKHAVDNTLLNAGLYDSEWAITTGVNAALNYFFISHFIFR